MSGLRTALAAAFGALVALLVAPYLPGYRLSEPIPPAPVIEARGDLAGDEAATIELFRQAQSSVVFITTTRRGGGSLFSLGAEVPRGTGSGFVWDDAGHVVTNAHVLRGASGATVRLPGGRAVRARLVGTDERHDLAVLRVPGMGMRPLPLGRSATLEVGQKVFAIGNPFGLDFTLTTGIISALGRDVPGERGLVIRGAIQTDAAINPGNSGGPLLDSAGRVIGVNTAIYSPSGASAGIGFAVPVDAVMRVVPQLIERGTYAPPVLGVSGDPRADAMLRASGVPPGVVVLDVVPGGPAARAGLEPARMTARGFVPGDVIEAVDGASVATMDDLLAQLDRRAPGDAVTLTLRDADGDRREVTVELVEGV